MWMSLFLKSAGYPEELLLEPGKVADGKLLVIDKLASGGKDAGKTANLRSQLAKLGAENALIVGGAELNEAFTKAARNIPMVDVLPQQGINVYDILRRDVLVLSKDK